MMQMLSLIFAIVVGLMLIATFLSVVLAYGEEDYGLALLTGFVGFVNIGLVVTLFVLALVTESVVAISIIGGLAIVAVFMLWLLHVLCAVAGGLGWLGWSALFADIVCVIGLATMLILGLM